MGSTAVPNVIVIGGSKCGTTALYHYFSKHPDIYVPPKKELHYHSSIDLLRNVGGPGDKYIIKEICKDQADYRSYFKNAYGYKAVVDISPSYLFFPSSIGSIKDFCGEVKIICLVRHPVEKMISQYSHLLSDGLETLSFEKALNQEVERKSLKYSDMWLYKESAFMADKINDFKNQFNNILTINNADLVENLRETLSLIFNFISVDPQKYPDYTPIVKNASGLPKSQLISTIFLKPNLFTFILRRIVPQNLGKVVREWINNSNKGEKFNCSEATFRSLEQELAIEIQKLNLLVNSKSKIRLRYQTN